MKILSIVSLIPLFTISSSFAASTSVITGAFVNANGQMLVRFNDRDNDYLCDKQNCQELDPRIYVDGEEIGLYSNIPLLDGIKITCPGPTSKNSRIFQTLEKSKLEELQNELEAGQIPLTPLPKEAKEPKFYYEDKEKNVIFVDMSKYIPYPGNIYRFFEGKAPHLKEVKVKSFNANVAGSVLLKLEDGRELNVGDKYPTVSKNDQTFGKRPISKDLLEALQIPGAESYKINPKSPCESINHDKVCVTEKDCPLSNAITSSGREILKPASEKDISKKKLKQSSKQ